MDRWTQVPLHPIVNTCYVITLPPMGPGETVGELYIKKDHVQAKIERTSDV